MRRSLAAWFAAVVVVLACADDPVGPRLPLAALGTVILNGGTSPGVSVVPDTGSSSHVGFGPAFDGDRFTLDGDTLLATSSAFSGDQLYVADLGEGVLLRVQLPAGSNPAGVAIVPSGAAGAELGRYLVALRSAGSLAQVNLAPTAGDTVRVIADAGRCPYDAVYYREAAWVVDANQLCAGQYEVQGASRLIRVPLSGAARDTISLGLGAIGASRVFILQDFAFVFAGGCPPFYQGCSPTPASITKVNLAAGAVTGSVSLPAGVFGITMTLGADGRLYLTGARELFGSGFAPRVYVVDPQTLAFVRSSSAADPYRALVAFGNAPKCFVATADADGRIHCVENGETLASLFVFAADGQLHRVAPAGATAFDIAVR